jgi:hypothetical protein
MAQGTCGFTTPENWLATFYTFRPPKLEWLAVAQPLCRRWSTDGKITEARWLVFDHLHGVDTEAKFHSHRSPRHHLLPARGQAALTLMRTCTMVMEFFGLGIPRDFTSTYTYCDNG